MEKLTSDDFLKPRIFRMKEYQNEMLLSKAYMIHINALSKINKTKEISLQDAIEHVRTIEQVVSTDYAFNLAVKELNSQ